MIIKLTTVSHRGCIRVSVVSSSPSAPEGPQHLPLCASWLAVSSWNGKGTAEPELRVFLASTGRNACHGCLGKSVNIFPVLLALVVTFSRDAANTKFNSF